MVRRTIGFVLTVVLVIVTTHHLEYNPELRRRLLDDPWESVGLLVLLAAAITALVWACAKPSQVKTLLAFGLGIASALWAREIFAGIKWGEIGLLVGAVLLLLILWAITVLPDKYFDRLPFAVSRRTPAPATP